MTATTPATPPGTVDGSGIRTEKGLSVAVAGQALGANFGLEADDGSVSIANTGGGSIGGDIAIAPPAAIPVPVDGFGVTDENRLGIDIAPYPFGPALQQGVAGLTVQGYGSATAAADEAVIEMWFYRDGYSFFDDKPFPEPVPFDTDEPIDFGGSDGDFFDEPAPVEPITEADLAPVIGALESFGADVEFVDQNFGYRDPFYASATLRATMSDLDSVDAAIDAATTAADGLTDVVNSGSSTYFSLSDCSALERAAMTAAVEDAKNAPTSWPTSSASGVEPSPQRATTRTRPTATARAARPTTTAPTTPRTAAPPARPTFRSSPTSA